MDDLLSSIQQAINDKNWFAALFLSLTLPDICGGMQFPSLKVGERYKEWYDKYLSVRYKGFLSAIDCYGLRNACLHEGSDTHPAMCFNKIHFIAPEESRTIHCNFLDDVLQLQIDCFCNDICSAVKVWLKEIENNNEIKEKVNNLMKVYSVLSLKPFISII